MFLRTLYLHNFRCYSDAVFEFCPGINTIVGPNAQGKTSILEAIYFLITGRSFRTTQASDLIRLGAPFFFLEAAFIKHGVEQRLRVSWSAKSRKITYNSTAYSSTTSLLGLLQGVVLTPDDVDLVKGAPQVRRQFIDLQMAQSDPLYVHHLTRYHRALRQRNVLLKAKNRTTLEIWESEMATSAAYLVQQRLNAIDALQTSGSHLYQLLSGERDLLALKYKTPLPAAIDASAWRHAYLQQFQRLRVRELALGYTLMGPHKDDLSIAIGEKEASSFGSEGQQRSCVAALHFAKWERLHRQANETPLMLIDDVGISLDQSRRGRLLDHLDNLGQVFLTTTQELPIHAPSKEQRLLHIPSLPVNSL